MNMRMRILYIFMGVCVILGMSYIYKENTLVHAEQRHMEGTSKENSSEAASTEEATTEEITTEETTIEETTTEEITTEETTTEETTAEECQHDYKTVVKAATNKTNGYQEEQCNICGEKGAKTIIYRIKSIKLSETAYSYDGRTKRPKVTAYDGKGNKISSSNYKVTYQNGRRKPGRYCVTIEFSGNYSGTFTRYFHITPRGVSVKTIVGGQGSVTVTLKAAGKTFTGYQIQYSKKKNFSSGVKTKTVSKGKNAYKIANLDTNARYYVRVRTYLLSGGKKVYSQWSDSATARTKIYRNMNIVSTDHQKYSYEEMVQDIAQLQKRYKDHCTVNILGTTADKRNLYEVIVGNPDADKHLIVLSNLHAREYMTVQLCMKQIEYYLNYYNKTIGGVKVSSVLDEVAIHFMPSCNPDGTAIAQFGFDAIRNKRLRNNLYKMGGLTYKWKSNARGVDLNQNWDIDFEVHGTKGSDWYSGKKPHSEAEVKAIIKMLDRVETEGEIVGFLSYHAMGEVIYGMCAPEAGETMAKTVDDMYSVAYKQSKYVLCGSTSISCNQSREYLMYKRGIPGITLEIGSSETPLDISQFAPTWRKNKRLVLLEAALFCE